MVGYFKFIFRLFGIIRMEFLFRYFEIGIVFDIRWFKGWMCYGFKGLFGLWLREGFVRIS